MLPVRMLQVFSRSMLGIRPARRFAWPWVVRLRTQYASVVPAIEVETRFDDGVRVRTSLSSHIEAQLFWQGFQEADEGTVIMMKALLPSDGVFIDCGANIGSFTLVAARHCPGGEVHAFEPSRHHIERLQHNIRLNGFDNVRLNPQGVSDESTRATLHVPATSGQIVNTGGATMFAVRDDGPAWVTEQIDLVRLDDYVLERKLTRVDLIKIDIEGAELQALKGARELLAKFRPRVLMELDIENLKRAGVSLDDMLTFWAGLDYEVLRLEGANPVHMPAGSPWRKHQNVLCRPR